MARTYYMWPLWPWQRTYLRLPGLFYLPTARSEMAGNFSVSLDTKILAKAIINLGNRMDKVLDVGGNNIAANQKALIVEQDIIDTGATLNSVDVFDVPGERFQRRIGPTTEYAPPLEFGTSRMPARPFVIPALQMEEKAFLSAVEQTYKQVIERG